jgi:hypothetical protein
MRFQSSVAVAAPLALATGAAVSAESIGAVDNAVSSSQMMNSLSTTNNENAPMTRRLLQKYKKRKQLFGNNASSISSKRNNAGMPDVGILSKSSDTPRFLDGVATDGDEATFFCPRTTCPQALCDCAENGGSLEMCSPELQSVCLNGQLADCVFSDYVEVYRNVYCAFTFCLNDGFLENQCDCAFYDMYCAQIQEDKDKCNLINADADADVENMPFFGCDETELATVCNQAKSCKDSGDLNGLPLGEWKGMAYRMNGAAGGKSSSGVVMGALGLLSAFLFLLNN